MPEELREPEAWSPPTLSSKPCSVCSAAVPRADHLCFDLHLVSPVLFSTLTALTKPHPLHLAVTSDTGRSLPSSLTVPSSLVPSTPVWLSVVLSSSQNLEAIFSLLTVAVTEDLRPGNS